MNDSEHPRTWLARRRVLKSKKRNGNGAGIPLAISAQMWLTPKTPTGGGQKGRATPGGGLRKIEDQVEQFREREREITTWQTPTGGDAKNRTYQYDRHDKTKPRLSLSGRAERFWMTPSVPNGGRKAKGGMSPTGKTQDGKKRQVGLENQVTASHLGHPAQETPKSGRPSSPRGRTSRPQLNPRFCEWLMGLPIGLTAYASPETELTQWLRRQRSLLFGVGSDD